MKHFFAAVALVCAMAPVQAQSWSGVYWSGSKTTFTSVELVETAGGAVVGRFKQYKAGSGGKLELLDAPLIGAVAGHSFVGKVEARWLEGGTTAVSGKRSGERIELTGSGGFRTNLVKSIEGEVARLLDRFAEYVRHVEQERVWAAEQSKRDVAAKKRVEGLSKLVRESRLYIEQGSRSYTQFQGHPARYAATTTKLRDMSAQWQSIRGDSGDASGKRSTLAAAMLHTSIDETQHPHIKVSQAFERSMNQLKELEEGNAYALKVCAEPQGPAADAQVIVGLCSQVLDLQSRVSAAGSESKERFRELNAVYALEAREQEALLTSFR